MTLVSDPAEVTRVAAQLARSPLVAFDLEFASADRLVPALCLIQVAWLGEDVSLDAPEPAIVAAVPEVRLIDPMAADAAPLVAALAAHPLVIAHAPRQDLALLVARYGVTVAQVLDTQLMAAFAGLGDQVGFATLANELLGLALAKDQQWTDWGKRPLSAAQLVYADADVRHLPAIYAKLAARLGQRVAWAREESAQIVGDAVAAASVTPETAWREVGGTRGLDARAQAALVALAAWRQRVATELDRPLGQVLPDKALVELARHRPDAPGQVRSFKGISPLVRTRAEEIVAALAAPPPELPSAPSSPRGAWRAPSPRAQRWSEMLLAIVQLVCEQTGIAPRLLATRADADEFARIYDEQGPAAAAQLPALTTWRREILGEVWEGWLSGRIAVIGDPAATQGIRLVPRT